MAEDQSKTTAADSQNEEVGGADPIETRSLSWHLAIASFVLMFSMGYALYDEILGSRPWKHYQTRWVSIYSGYLESIRPGREEAVSAVRDSEEFQDILRRLTEAENAIKGDLAKRDDEVNNKITPTVNRINIAVKATRSKVTELLYKIETATEAKKEDKKKALKELREAKTIECELNGELETKSYDEWMVMADELKARKNLILAERRELTKTADAIRKEMNDYLGKNLIGLTDLQVDGLLDGMRNFKFGLKEHQIHVQDVNLVDRCTACHLGMEQPLTLTPDALLKVGATKEEARLFQSHPNMELLKIHPPELYGCSPCHGGNGIATTSVTKAHGKYHHWLWPLYDKENTEAGCIQCHEGSIRLEKATVLNKGLDVFLHRGCWGCHPREGFDKESGLLQQIDQRLFAIAGERIDIAKEIKQIDDQMADMTEAEQIAAQARDDELKVRLSTLSAEEQQLQLRHQDLARQRKTVGPNLKLIKGKLNPDWLEQWIEHPRHFRPDTRMPEFRLNPGEAKKMAAYLWQNADEPNNKPYAAGDAVKGETLYNTRGCMGCHSIGEEGAKVGGSFAANLSRMGEKADFNYITGWILNPAPTAVMPNLRLTEEEARDIATYIMSQKHDDVAYEKADYISDEKLAAEGFDLIKHYGCFGCHSIKGTEKEGKTGTDLTKEGSKPIERLDFALFTEKAHHHDWYNHKGFFMHKLQKPNFFDEGKHKTNPKDFLKMPSFWETTEKDGKLHSSKEDLDEIKAVTTFLMGSVESKFPTRFYDSPEGWDKDIQDGWWVIKKYNCMGCHQIADSEKPEIQSLDIYKGEANVVKAPPPLIAQGSRVDSEWLRAFLRDPSLGRPNSNGVRAYLDVRMPTFAFSDEEINTLVRFFNAMAKQPLPYTKPKLEILTGDDLIAAREAFHYADCLECHAQGSLAGLTEEQLKKIIAPSFVVARDRLKPHWTERWLKDPNSIQPNTQMPALFSYNQAEKRWKLQKGDKVPPDALNRYTGDHVTLFQRYLNQFDDAEAEELKKLRNK